MPSKEEKRRRKSLIKIIDQKETAEAIDNMPISFKELAKLLDHLDEQLGVEGCDHTPRMTIKYLENINLPSEEILSWLREYSGYCDCEVLANVEDSWETELEQYTQQN